MENYAKIHPTWQPNSIKHEKIYEKGMQKTMPKFDAEKKFKSEILDAVWDPLGGCLVAAEYGLF